MTMEKVQTHNKKYQPQISYEKKDHASAELAIVFDFLAGLSS